MIYFIDLNLSVDIDNILTLTKENLADNLQKLELMLNKLKGKGLKCNIEKFFFGETEMEYLGFWVTRDDVKPINRKIEAMTNIVPSSYRK